MRVMDELKDQAEQITNTNHDVTEAMTKLQDKTKEVEEIAGDVYKRQDGRMPKREFTGSGITMSISGSALFIRICQLST